MIIAVVLTIVVVAFLCWLLFTLATYALPLFVGVSMGQWAYHSGAGALGGLALGVLAAVLTFLFGQLILLSLRSPFARASVMVLFVTPAAVAGFSAAHGLAKLGVPSDTWQDVFGVLGAAAVGVSAWIKLTSTWVMAPDNGRAPVQIGPAPN